MVELTDNPPAPVDDDAKVVPKGEDAARAGGSIDQLRHSISSVGSFTRPAQQPEQNAPVPAPAPAAAPVTDPLPDPLPDPAVIKAVDNVLLSDIGVVTLLGRLKQSVATAKDLASFLKRRSAMEDEHSKEMRRLCRLTSEALSSRDSRPASVAYQFEEVIHMHERIADNELSFGLNLHQMSVDLDGLAHEIERGRKQWKATGLSAEGRVQDAEKALDKAKLKYDGLAVDYDHAKTGDKVSGRGFSLRPKTGANLEEDLLRKLNAADQDYQMKVQQAQSLRQDLVTSARPQAVQALLQLIKECDSGVTLQMQKFAAFNEKLLLGNGLLISPLPEKGMQRRSLREVIGDIDNDQDFRSYVLGHAGQVPHKRENVYIRHPTLVPAVSAKPQRQRERSPPSAPVIVPVVVPTSAPAPAVQQPDTTIREAQKSVELPASHQAHELEGRSVHHSAPYSGHDVLPPQPSADSSYPQSSNSGFGGSGSTYAAQGPPGAARPGSRGPQFTTPQARPFFGVYLYDIFVRDQTPVPLVVQECINAVEEYGLNLEGIYRVNGNNTQVAQMRAQFESDPQSVDYGNPEAFFHDPSNAAGLLKQFLRELPDPLLTTEAYQEFLDAAAVTDDTQRRDRLHGIINGLPDPNYATLRALTLHLHRVIDNSDKNRMNANNIAVIFSPTLMGPHSGPVQEPALQYRAIETILVNALEIFDED